MTRAAMRQATLADLEELMAWRLAVLREVFHLPTDYPLADLAAASRRYYADELPPGRHVAAFALGDGGAIIGCGGLCLQREMPSPDNPGGLCAYLMDIYVAPARRGQGVGRTIAAWLVDAARQRRAAKVYLESSEPARALYLAMGFAPMHGMMRLGDAT